MCAASAAWMFPGAGGCVVAGVQLEEVSTKSAVVGGLVARLCETCCVREREFWQLLEEVFGRVYGRSLSKDQRLPKLGDMTVVEALAAGEEPRVVWNVLCDQMDIPDSRRWGKDHNAPPLPAGR